MAESLSKLCKPRQNIFDKTRRDVVLDISDVIDGRINPKGFFEENYLTEGMKLLFNETFRRFAKKSDTAIITLTQAMGGGKTHCMIGLALLAKYPELRKEIMGSAFGEDVYGEIKVVAFNGRESDAPYGIWGSIAEQIGKRDFFKDYYSPLQAPGKTAWVNLLKGERLLILLDELPPYFENAQSITVGNSDLSVVTSTALSNLLVALGSAELSQICVVISDLKATYEGGSQKIIDALHNFEQEVGRGSMNLEPVGLNTDEIYQILKKRLFSEMPDDATILAIAQEYGESIRDAEKMGMVHVSPEKMVQQIRDSYPLHPAIKDLYARFRENPGFQQTRGLIRFMRVLTSNLYESSLADNISLIHPHMIDLNNPDMISEINLINPTLGNAISHDIASGGNAVAEIEDAKRGGSDATDICNLILMSSLANIESPVLGLTQAEMITDICAPGRDITTLPDVISSLEGQLCWYLHRGNDGKIYFKNTENLIARLRSLAESYAREAVLKDVKGFLEQIFLPERKDCYQEVQILPAIDDITVSSDKVRLVLFEPHGGPLHPDLESFYNSLDYKNRICFLSGQKDTMNNLITVGREYRAIRSIISGIESSGVRTDDPQRIFAQDLQDNIIHRLLSASRETFTRLTYPHMDKLMNADIIMNFEGNKCRGEELIRNTLLDKQKFTEDIDSETFQKKCQERLFTQQSMLWSEIKKRSAILTKWPWHHPSALDRLKEKMVHEDQWRIEGNYIDKGPFPAPSAGVKVMNWNRDPDTGETILKIVPVHGDTVYYELGGDATEASAQVVDWNNFVTTEMSLNFICVDSKGVHDKSHQYVWKNTLELKKRVHSIGNTKKKVELQSLPPGAVIRYTTDGSNSKNCGGIYSDPFEVDRSCRLVLAIAEKDDVWSEELHIPLNWEPSGPEIDLKKPATWKQRHDIKTTKESYEFLENVKKYGALVPAVGISVVGKKWVELRVDENIELTGEKIEGLIESLRSVYADGEVSIEAPSMKFKNGQDLIDFADDEKKNVTVNEVSQ